MISFIIIGRNEGWKLTKCFESVYKTIEENNLTDSEVIYVDSKSTDDSIARAKEFPKIRTFQITGHCNAAIGRNIGAKESKGDVLFFIDGDMEIQPDFLPLVYDGRNGLKYDFVSGSLLNYIYDSSGKLLSKENYGRNKKLDYHTNTTGGLFLIKRKIWDQVGGMKNKMRRSQDLDLGLRLAKKGIFSLREKELLAIHHTIPYNDKKRMWKMLFSGADIYRVVLLRENFWNKFEWKLFLRGNYTFAIMILLMIISFSLKNVFYLFFYPLFVLIRILARGEKSFRLILSRLIYIPAYELSFLGAFLLFWPKNYKLEYFEMK